MKPFEFTPRPHVPGLSSRREFLLKSGGGFGAVALACFLQRDGLALSAESASTVVNQKFLSAIAMLSP